MWVKFLTVIFIGGFVGLDTTAAWQVLFSHPLFACSVLGLVFGELQLGLFFGVLFELIWLYDLPVGGAKFPEGNISSFIGLILVLSLKESTSVSLEWLVFLCSVYTVGTAYLFGMTTVLQRRNNRWLVARADCFAEQGQEKKVARVHLLGIFHSYLHGALWGLIFYSFGFVLLRPIANHLPPRAPFTLNHLQALYLGVGLMLMFHLFFLQRKLGYLVFGLACGLGLGIVV